MFEAFHGREQILHHLKYFRMKLIVNVPALDDAELSGVLALEQQERLSVRKAQRKPRESPGINVL